VTKTIKGRVSEIPRRASCGRNDQSQTMKILRLFRICRADLAARSIVFPRSILVRSDDHPLSEDSPLNFSDREKPMLLQTVHVS